MPSKPDPQPPETPNGTAIRNPRPSAGPASPDQTTKYLFKNNMAVLRMLYPLITIEDGKLFLKKCQPVSTGFRTLDLEFIPGLGSTAPVLAPIERSCYN